MSNHHKERPNERGTGPVDKDRVSPKTKMNREMRNTDAGTVTDRDLRGRGREAMEQQEREPNTRDDREHRRPVA